MDEKPCRICGAVQPVTEFHRAKGMRDGHRNECKTCFRAIARKRYQADPQKMKDSVKRWQRENPDHFRAYQAEYRNRPERKRAMRDLYYLRTHGISADEADRILKSQNGRCAICCRPAPERLGAMHLDHDHTTGQIRGFLCVDCNHGIGKLRDSPDLLLRALVYLRQRSKPKAVTGS